MNEKEDIIRVLGRDFKAGFNWSVGFQMERFIKALGKKKILASKCPKCGYTYSPRETGAESATRGLKKRTTSSSLAMGSWWDSPPRMSSWMTRETSWT